MFVALVSLCANSFLEQRRSNRIEVASLAEVGEGEEAQTATATLQQQQQQHRAPLARRDVSFDFKESTSGALQQKDVGIAPNEEPLLEMRGGGGGA